MFFVVFWLGYITPFAITFSMPPRKKATGILTSVGEHHQLEPSANHVSMHSEGTESSSEAGHLENKNIMAAIEDLQHSQAAMWAKLQSLHQETAIPQAPQGDQGPQGSPYLTKEDIFAILFEAKKLESVVYVDTKPPYSKEIAGTSYLANYTPPIFPKYDGMTGNAREHIKQYVDALRTHSHDHDLRLREFSKSLEGHAFTWYTSLAPDWF